ncbi:MAG: DUF1326 domain-containing protein [Acidobacteriia bacterium]|nr:DUF1326 domain-containing protein [Terriglobia bacterium]
MRKILTAGSLGLFVLALAAMTAKAAIRGDYIEVRSADVYTGACFANSEVGLVGKEAILAWKVKDGNWNGVDLSGLGVVAVVRAQSTLGDPYHNPYPAKSVLILDERASPAQREALEAFAKAMAGKLVEHVVRVDAAPIDLEVVPGHHDARAKLTAGTLARIETRSLCTGDHLCGNEFVYYPPLTQVANAMPAYTIEEAFTGKGLDAVWWRADKRSAFIGSFAR